MIKLVGINKIYRTNEIETVALEDVNLTVNIEVAGTRIESMKDKELAAFRNKKLGFVFQSFHLINSLNVLDNVELPLLYRRMSSSERKRLAQDVLAKVGLSHRMRHFPSQLSGGQCQRVAVARAIIGNPEIILADEPTGNLDNHNAWEIMKLLEEINSRGTTVVVVTHNLEIVKAMNKRVITMKKGVVVEDSEGDYSDED